MWQLGAAQFGLGDDRDPRLDFGVNHFTGVALAAVGLSVVAFHETLTAGFDSAWSNYLPSMQYRHAAHHRLFMHQIGL
jgi:hypothetical protein